jgi:cyclase
MRAKFNAVHMETQKLADNVTMFSGPGGSVVVLNGPNGKFVVDTFVAPAWPKLKDALAGLGNSPDGALAGLHFDPSPAEALPQQTFPASYKLQANSETLALEHLAPAHTDSDIYVHFQEANVISMGDTFFNGMYPYIDPGTGGKITGMIAAADKILSVADTYIKIVAGHGPLGNKAVADLDPFWGKGIINSDQFVQIVYLTL